MGAHTGSHIIRALLPKLRNSARVWCDSLGVTGNLSGSFWRTELPQQESARIAQDRADSGYHWLTPGGELATCISSILKTGSFGALLCETLAESQYFRDCAGRSQSNALRDLVETEKNLAFAVGSLPHAQGLIAGCDETEAVLRAPTRHTQLSSSLSSQMQRYGDRKSYDMRGACNLAGPECRLGTILPYIVQTVCKCWGSHEVDATCAGCATI